MQVQTFGASRPKLTLPFGRIPVSQAAIERRSPTLTGHELRRIVSEILG
mgnify:CR=1 FL=1